MSSHHDERCVDHEVLAITAITSHRTRQYQSDGLKLDSAPLRLIELWLSRQNIDVALTASEPVVGPCSPCENPQWEGVIVKWVTRERPKTDRIACPWLIKRFIDPEAEILYVPRDQVLATVEREGAVSFDAPGATYTHRGNKCSFEVLVDEYDLGSDAALIRLAKIVHAADVASEIDSDPVGRGLEAIGVGGLDVESDDHVLLERGSFIYDALYAWCVRQVSS